MDAYSWWNTRFRILKGYQNEAGSLFRTTSIANEAGPQAIQKLAILAYYITVYTTIIKKRFKLAYYVDFFAGPGLDRIDNKEGDILLGSPLLADRVPAPSKKFDKLLLFESNAKKAFALQKLLPSAKVRARDVNTISDLSKELELRDCTQIPMLGFVDPFAISDLKWTTLVKLIDCWSDVIINFQTTIVRRSAAQARSTGWGQALNEFYGTQSWRSLNTDEEFLQFYKDRLRERKGKDAIVESIRIRGRGGFFYDLLFVVKKTGGSQDWISAIHEGKTMIESIKIEKLEELTQVFFEHQPSIDSFLSIQDIEMAGENGG
jgi:three-Cys-motif partner protein